MVKITFPDGSVKEYSKGTNSLEIAEQISPRLSREVFAATVNGEVMDLTRPILSDSSLKLHNARCIAVKLHFDCCFYDRGYRK